MTTPKQLRREARRKNPAKWAEIDKRWDMKMTIPVLDFVMGLNQHIYGKVPKDQALYNGPEIEKEVWKLLRKVRRITQLEKK